MAALLVVACPGGPAFAAKLQVLVSFGNLRGSMPQNSLLADAAGNLYGTTIYYGPRNSGVAFKLTR